MDENEKYWTLRAMRVYGGGFIRELANAFFMADPTNFHKLRVAFSEYWEQYKKLGKCLMEKEIERELHTREDKETLFKCMACEFEADTTEEMEAHYSNTGHTWKEAKEDATKSD